MEKIRVLLADDNRANTKMLMAYLADKTEIEIVGCAEDGVQTLQLVNSQSPDLLLLDIIMPRLDGFAVLEALAEMEAPPRTIVMTGLLRDDFVQRAMRLGAEYYIVKPMDPQVLYARILEVAGREREKAPAKPVPTPDGGLDAQVTDLFLTIGIPAHIKGYQYLREAVRMVADNHDVINRITKELYPGIARRYNTSASKVERAMRHAIEVAWSRGRLDAVNQLYGFRVFSPDDKPTNGEFIALVADKVVREKSA